MKATPKSPASQTQPGASSASIPCGLYLVATPIGNLADITLRALDTLRAADLIACEDTRITSRLLSHYGISAPCLSYNDHNGEQRRPRIMEALAAGKRVALVSDAGTPLISDPGYKLVREVQQAGFRVTALPGPSSVLTGLCISGLPTDRFCFIGFLPTRAAALKKEMSQLASIPATLVAFESARRLPESLPILAQVFGDRPAAVTRELTKLFEECRRGSLSELAAHYEKEGPPKGEVVLVIGPPLEGHDALTPEEIEHRLVRLLKTHSVKEAAAQLAAETGQPRKELYALALTLKE